MKVRELVDNIRKNMEAIKRDIMNNQLLLITQGQNILKLY